MFTKNDGLESYTFTITKRVYADDLKGIKTLWLNGEKADAVKLFRLVVGCDLGCAMRLCREYCEEV